MNTRSILALLFLFCSGSLLTAQMDLPRKSPRASVSYTIAYTTVNITYSSPAVKGREIWGELEPYNQLWRAGANEATTIEFSTPVKVEGKSLPQGKYAFFLIPKEEGKWMAIFNKDNEQWGAYSYDKEQDALRVEVGMQESKVNEERLNYTVVEQEIDQGYIRLGWGHTRVYIRFQSDLLNQLETQLNSALLQTSEEDRWKTYAQAADLLSESSKYGKQALAYAEESTNLFSHSSNWWIKARIQASMEDYQAAIESAKKAAEAGKADEKDRFYRNSKSRIERMVADWESKTR
ncbi:MAG: DUF2911 domain-containing protein [Saprospiraceae bacterium]|nr:DUF2911 domain-containing protein [Saprospiraceae bacterium]